MANVATLHGHKAPSDIPESDNYSYPPAPNQASKMVETKALQLMNSTSPVPLGRPPMPSELEFSPMINHSAFLNALAHLLSVDSTMPALVSFIRTNKMIVLYICGGQPLTKGGQIADKSPEYFLRVRALVASLFRATKTPITRNNKYQLDCESLREPIQDVLTHVVHYNKSHILALFRKMGRAAEGLGIIRAERRPSQRTKVVFGTGFTITCLPDTGAMNNVFKNQFGVSFTPSGLTMENMFMFQIHEMADAALRGRHDKSKASDRAVMLWMKVAATLARYLERHSSNSKKPRMEIHNPKKTPEENRRLQDELAYWLKAIGSHHISVRICVAKMTRDRMLHKVWNEGKIEIREVPVPATEPVDAEGKSLSDLIDTHIQDIGSDGIKDEELRARLAAYRISTKKLDKIKEKISAKPHLIPQFVSFISDVHLGAGVLSHKVILDIGVSPPLDKWVSTTRPWCCKSCEIYLRNWRKYMRSEPDSENEDGEENYGIEVNTIPKMERGRFRAAMQAATIAAYGHIPTVNRGAGVGISEVDAVPGHYKNGTACFFHGHFSHDVGNSSLLLENNGEDNDKQVAEDEYMKENSQETVPTNAGGIVQQVTNDTMSLDELERTTTTASDNAQAFSENTPEDIIDRVTDWLDVQIEKLNQRCADFARMCQTWTDYLRNGMRDEDSADVNGNNNGLGTVKGGGVGEYDLRKYGINKKRKREDDDDGEEERHEAE